MKSPQDMRIIQIDITNACIHQCSNCTRFCGHHKKPFYMDFDTFKKAVDSFEGYNGTVGIMGGEPTLHPEFERFLEYLNEHKYYPKTDNLLNKPTDQFMKVIAKMEQRDTFINHEHGIDRRCVQGYGLWTALSNNYLKYYELIQDTFNFQACNDHTNIMYHSPIMVRRKDLGISDEEWPQIRDNCWAQGEWSATITSKGAFFCEIAGALDMLFDGPGGWPIEPGWWKRKPEEFGDQLRWCELCGITMSTFTRDANDEIDDMSQWYFDRLQELDSPKLKQGLHNVLKIDRNGTIAEESKAETKERREFHYTDSYFARFHKDNDWLNPTDLVGLLIMDDASSLDDYKKVIVNASVNLDKLMVVTGWKKAVEYIQDHIRDKNNVEILIEEINQFGIRMNKALRNLAAGRNPFLVLLNMDSYISGGCKDFLKHYVLNPGSILVNCDDEYLKDRIGENVEAIFSPYARALRKATRPIIAGTQNLQEFISLWDSEKIIYMKKASFEYQDYEVEKGVKYALYGCGPTAESMMCRFEEEQVIAVADTDCRKWGQMFCGHNILSPEELLNRAEEYDKIFITSRYYFEIKDMLLGMGVPMNKIVSSVNVM